jgi:hypothetical protein
MLNVTGVGLRSTSMPELRLHISRKKTVITPWLITSNDRPSLVISRIIPLGLLCLDLWLE